MSLITFFTPIMIPDWYIYHRNKVTFEQRLMLIHYVCFLIHKTIIFAWYIHTYLSRWMKRYIITFVRFHFLLRRWVRFVVTHSYQYPGDDSCPGVVHVISDDVIYQEIRLNHRYPQAMKLNDKIYRRLIPLYPCVASYSFPFNLFHMQ